MPASLPDLAKRYLAKDPRTLDVEERNVLASFEARRTISRDAAEIEEETSTFWDRLADRVAAIGGSWAFIFSSLGLLLGWMLLNADILTHWHAAFDPYPFIFLNLLLSMTAALQAPVIMMSQNRQSARDRVAASHDYEVNLRAELEIMRVHEKIDAMEIARLHDKLDAVIARLDEKPAG